MSAETMVSDFGRAIGMPKLAFNDKGVVRLRFERTGTLSIERTDRGAILLLARAVDRFDETILGRALELCQPDGAEKLRPGAGLAKDGSLVFWVRLEDAALDLSSFENALDFLRLLHDKAARPR